MLRSLNKLLGSTILAKDGELGKIHDFLFDDRAWTVRYLDIETGSWLSSRRVLLSPSAAGRPDWEKLVVPVDLTMDQVRNSPDIDTAKPVSRQEEIAMVRHYGWAAYWTMEPPLLPVQEWTVTPSAPEGDPHLRSVREVATYGATTGDEEIGRIDDFIMEDANWFIRYLVVNTGSWFSGQKLLLSTRWVGTVSWPHKQILFARSLDEM